jgi:hypothetical protein
MDHLILDVGALEKNVATLEQLTGFDPSSAARTRRVSKWLGGSGLCLEINAVHRGSQIQSASQAPASSVL